MSLRLQKGGLLTYSGVKQRDVVLYNGKHI